MSESKNRQEPLSSFEFNRSIKVRKESPAITSNAGVLLLREIEDKLAVIDSLAKALHDPRDQNYVRYSLSELLRERVFAFALGYARQDDADTLAHDPAFRLAVWDRLGTQLVDERLASQPTASRAMDIFSRWHNREAIRQHLFTPILRHQRQGSDDQKVSLGVVDIDGFPIETHGGQPGAVYNGYYRKTIYSPLTACFSANGTFDAKRLGEGFIHAMLPLRRKGRFSSLTTSSTRQSNWPGQQPFALTPASLPPTYSIASMSGEPASLSVCRIMPRLNAWRLLSSRVPSADRQRKAMNSRSNSTATKTPNGISPTA